MLFKPGGGGKGLRIWMRLTRIRIQFQPSRKNRIRIRANKIHPKLFSFHINGNIIVIISILSTLIVIMTICGIIFFIKFKHSKIDNFNEKKILEKTNASKTNASKPLHRIPKKRNMITKKRRNITNLPPIEEKKIENPIKIEIHFLTLSSSLYFG